MITEQAGSSLPRLAEEYMSDDTSSPGSLARIYSLKTVIAT